MGAETDFLDNVRQLSVQWVPDVLETMFFATAIQSPEARTSIDALRVDVAFRGAPSGVFTIETDRAVTSALAAAFLGKFDEDEVSPAEAAEVAREMANMLCGSVLSRAESDAGFELEPPSLVAPADSFPADDDQPVCCERFLVDTGGALQISFRVTADSTVNV